MNAKPVADVPRLPPPDAMVPPAMPPAPVGARATHVWMEARHFFTRDSAQQFCWLWLLGTDGRVHALRVLAERAGDDHFARSLLARFTADPDLPIPAGRAFGPALPLPAAPIVPLPRWHVSWGHPLQQALRAFASQLAADVLAALGALEVPGPFFGSVANYNRLALLPDTVRRHRLQALAEFPALVAPLLLDGYERPDMFGTEEDEPEQAAECGHGAGAEVLDAMDRGRDLVGALAAHYGICRALVRAPMLRAPWARGCVPRDVLRLLDALPAHARPRSRADVEDRLPLLRALPLRFRDTADVAHLARVFARDWNETWTSLDGRAPTQRAPLAAWLRDTRDFLRAALEQQPLPAAAAALDMERLCLAWLARRGLASLLDASLRWHAQPLVPRAATDDPAGAFGAIPHDANMRVTGDLACVITPILGDADTHATFEIEGRGIAHEIVNQQALIEEGETMHHCVGGYWRMCVMDGVRIVHLAMADGESATAEYWLRGPADNPTFTLEELRGPRNAESSDAVWQFAEATLAALNAAACRDRRIAVATITEKLRAACRPPAPPVAVRRLDRRSQQELRMVLDWHARQADRHAAATVLLRAAIAGFTHANGPRLFPQLAPGDALHLAREPNNPYDARAVRIDWRGHKLGYVPRGNNADIAQLLDAGEALAVGISSVARQASAWDAVEFEITVAERIT